MHVLNPTSSSLSSKHNFTNHYSLRKLVYESKEFKTLIQVKTKRQSFLSTDWNWMRHEFNMLTIIVIKPFLHSNFTLQETEGGLSWQEIEREREGVSLPCYSPLMCDKWLCGRCEIGSIKMPHFSSGVCLRLSAVNITWDINTSLLHC